jgi:PAS domain-containing protein
MHRQIYLAMAHEQAEGAGWMAGVHPDDRQRVWEAWQTSIQTGIPFEVEHRLQDGTSGAYRWFFVRALPVRDDAGQIVKWFGTCTDIEEQKRAEQALRQSQERIRALIDSNIIGIVFIEGEEEVLVDANEAFLHLTGYSREDVHKRMLKRVKIIAPEQAPLFERAIQELTTHGQHVPLETELV